MIRSFYYYFFLFWFIFQPAAATIVHAIIKRVSDVASTCRPLHSIDLNKHSFGQRKRKYNKDEWKKDKTRNKKNDCWTRMLRTAIKEWEPGYTSFLYWQIACLRDRFNSCFNCLSKLHFILFNIFLFFLLTTFSWITFWMHRESRRGFSTRANMPFNRRTWLPPKGFIPNEWKENQTPWLQYCHFIRISKSIHSTSDGSMHFECIINVLFAFI